MATKYSIAEQVLLRVNGDRPDQANKLDIRDIIAMVPQVASVVLQMGYFNQTLPTGETIPDGLALATFTIPVTEDAKRSKAKLPARPISLPRGMGVFEISDPLNPYCVHIPALPGQLAMLQSQNMISDLGGSAAYEVYGNDVIFNKRLGVDVLQVRMFIVSLDGLTDHDPLPVPQDIELQIIDKLIERFAPRVPNNMDGDIVTDNKISQN